MWYHRRGVICYFDELPCYYCFHLLWGGKLCPILQLIISFMMFPEFLLFTQPLAFHTFTYSHTSSFHFYPLYGQYHGNHTFLHASEHTTRFTQPMHSFSYSHVDTKWVLKRLQRHPPRMKKVLWLVLCVCISWDLCL
jgi:hypothetical protein